MLRLVAVVVIAASISGPAHADAVRASRLYKLCQIEDPQCMPMLIAAYNTAVAEQARASHPVVCLRGHHLSEQQIWGTFMQMAGNTPEALGHDAVWFETYVLSFAAPCS